MARKRNDKPKRFFVPPARPVDREKNSPSGESGGAKRFWKRAEPLPTDTKWRGNADRVPPGYTKDRKWNCPSCDVKPGKRHEQWCPRYLYQLNPYDSSAYDNELFLADYMETQIWFGDGHPQTKSETARKSFPRDPGEILLEKAGIKKANPQQNLPGLDGELPF